MGFKCGIVGLPNVGKSTLFNALTESAAAQAANYPFCTIEPNVGDVPVPDPRLERARRDRQVRPGRATRLTFVDIAGLVRGASKGEGLGNQFLAAYPRGRRHRLRAALLRGRRRHPCRGPRRSDRRRRDGRDRADARRSRQPRAARADRSRRRSEAGQGSQADACAGRARARRCSREGKPARLAAASEEEQAAFKSLGLLTAKPVLYVCNVDEASAATGNVHSARVEALAKAEGAGCVIISAKIEAELAELAADERNEPFSPSSGLTSPASTASSAKATSCSASSPISPPGRRKRAPGP